MISPHLVEARGEEGAHRATFQEAHSGYTDYPPVQFSLALMFVGVAARMGCEGTDSGGDAASYGSDEAGTRDDAEQSVAVVAQTRLRVMQRLCFAISTG